MSDTTKQFILMCEKAEEIQELRMGIIDTNPYCGLWYDIDDIYFGIYGGNNGHNDVCVNTIWLPRQDQLQDIYTKYLRQDYITNAVNDEDKNHLLKSLISHTVIIFHYFVNPTKGSCCPVPYPQGKGGWLIFDSLEQLWLAFVMKEKYNKVWNGKDWIKICQN